MWWFQQGLSFLPAALVVWTAAAFVFAYITAVVLRHVDPLLPYISDTGTMAPERCLFGIMLDVSAFLGMATVYVRFKQVEALTGDAELKLSRLNRVGLLLGLTSSFGMAVVANFQKTTLFSMHLVGAVLTFGVGALYILVQTLLSLRMQPLLHSRNAFLVRLAIGVWTLGSIVIMFVSSVVMYSSLPGVDVCTGLQERRATRLTSSAPCLSGLWPSPSSASSSATSEISRKLLCEPKSICRAATCTTPGHTAAPRSRPSNATPPSRLRCWREERDRLLLTSSPPA
ncbi:DNA damage-regulated autophagy modulator protein 2-like isoform X1 [Pseudoliparis swirei]|uniref:DNA damage-regulated autophagy modulator protein 2-like isoform X1 n=1 Tax=Pseudoliparis swirei TaxID=2059687 RepID=UPI0024BEAE6D|nr:DNA damage-regulated autophagy modulator protein 2-like isoform X1 [Pseudoliparis swirei]